MVQMQIYDGLLEATADFSELKPALSDSWEVSDDRLVYTFHLRSGVKFSNGEPVTPEDVKFSLDALRDPERSPNRSVLLEPIASITTPDDSHVEVTLKHPFTAFLDYLILMPIVPKDVVEDLGDEAFGRNPVGAGPFMIKNYSPGNPTIELERNPHYWQEGLPYLDGIVYEQIADDNARMLAVESGAIDVADGVPFSQLDRIDSAEGVALFKQNALASAWIVVNGFEGPLSKVPVRQALVYATPLEQISQVAFHGVAPVAATASLPLKYLDESIEPYPHDVDKARQLLAQAGEEGLSLTLTVVSGDAVGKQVATILQSAWAEAGIELHVRQKDHDSVIGELVEQNFELAMLNPVDVTSDVAVDDEFAQFFIAPPEPGVFPWTGWENEEARRLVMEAMRSPSESVRQENFSAYQKILHEEQPMIGLVHVPNLFAVRTNVHNLVAVGEFWPLLEQVWLSE